MPKYQPQKRRAILTEQQAVEIFRLRSVSSMTMMVCPASVVAKRYGVNERTIRDIWKQRTWTHATCSFAEIAGPMAKRKMGRPVGSRDVRPRKQRPVARTSISYEPSTCATPVKCNATMPFWESRLRSELQEHSDKAQQDRIMQWRRSDCLLLDSSDDMAFLANQSPIEHEREQEASIDDQLHAWAHHGPQWIISAALPLHGDSPWDCKPSVR